MNSTRFVFKDGFPAEVLDATKAYFLPEEWLIPNWCTLVNVFWESGNERGASMCVNADYAYRCASITVYGGWMNGDAKKRREDVLHELTHIVVEPLAAYAEDTAEQVLKDDAKFAEHVKKEMRARCESVVSDFANLLNRKTASPVAIEVTEIPPPAT